MTRASMYGVFCKEDWKEGDREDAPFFSTIPPTMSAERKGSVVEEENWNMLF